MAKSGGKMSWTGLPDSRPCSSTKSQSDNYVPSAGGRGDWKGQQDSRPGSSSQSDSVNVSTGKG
jgi:hypothetical protein